MAAQMAQLLTRSDLDELREVVARWLHEAPTERIRKQYEVFGNKLIELKQALAEQEAMLQERIDKAQQEMQKAIQIREEMGVQNEESRQPQVVETTVTRQRTNESGIPSRQPSLAPPYQE